MNATVSNMNQPQVKGAWVQTERKAHEAWARLVADKPRAAQLLHLIVANMDRKGAIIASQATLAALAEVSVSTIKRAISDLVAGQWIQTVRIGSERGGAMAYIVNSRVAWSDKRENLKYSLFDARVIVSTADQESLDGDNLRQIPMLYPGEQQLPAGNGEDPPSQALIPGTEPNLPALTNR